MCYFWLESWLDILKNSSQVHQRSTWHHYFWRKTWLYLVEEVDSTICSKNLPHIQERDSANFIPQDCSSSTVTHFSQGFLNLKNKWKSSLKLILFPCNDILSNMARFNTYKRWTDRTRDLKNNPIYDAGHPGPNFNVLQVPCTIIPGPIYNTVMFQMWPDLI